MKTAKLFIAISLLAISISSCNNNNVGIEELLQEQAEMLATYLSDIYHVGDSVFFKNELGEIVGLEVRHSYFACAKYTDLPNMFAKPEEVITGYDNVVILQGQDEYIHLDLGNRIVENKICSFTNFKFLNEQSPILAMVQNTTFTGDSIIIDADPKFCILRRNVGIIKLVDREHTLELIRHK